MNLRSCYKVEIFHTTMTKNNIFHKSELIRTLNFIKMIIHLVDIDIEKKDCFLHLSHERFLNDR